MKTNPDNVMVMVITGGRSYNPSSDDRQSLMKAMMELSVGEVYVGDCPTGVDRWVREWRPNCRVFKARWDQHGRAAGPIRNREMLEAAMPRCVVAAFPGGRGTASCVSIARSMSVPIVRIGDD